MMSEKKLIATAPPERIGRRLKALPLTVEHAAAEEEVVVVTTTSSSVVESRKRRKVKARESEISTPAPNEKNELSAGAARSSTAACFDEEESADGFKSKDPEAGCFERDSNSSQIVSASSPETEVCIGLPAKEMESKSTGGARSRSVVYDAPSAEEIEEFFLAAEKIQAKRFKEKYNYDIVKDVPLEGRLKWERVKP